MTKKKYKKFLDKNQLVTINGYKDVNHHSIDMVKLIYTP